MKKTHFAILVIAYISVLGMIFNSITNIGVQRIGTVVAILGYSLAWITKIVFEKLYLKNGDDDNG